MNLQKAFFYLRGIILKPTSTFQAISVDPELKSYFVIVIFAEIFLAIVRFLIYKPISSIPGIESLGSFVDYIDTFSRISSLIPFGAIGGFVTFYISRMFSKSGTLIAFVTVFGILTTIGSLLGVIANFVPAFEIVSTLAGLWLGYLGFVAIYVLASVSKTKAVVISLIYSGIYVLIFGGVALYFILYVHT